MWLGDDMNEVVIFDEYAKMFSKLPKRLQTILQEEGKLSKEELIEQINLYIEAHQMNIVISDLEIDKIIAKEQTAFTASILKEAIENSDAYMHNLLDSNLENDEVVKLSNNVLKMIYSVIKKICNSEYFDNYLNNLKVEIYNKILETNETKENLSKYFDKIKYIIDESVTKNVLSFTENVKNKINNGYIKEMNDITNSLSDSLVTA